MKLSELFESVGESPLGNDRRIKEIESGKLISNIEKYCSKSILNFVKAPIYRGVDFGYADKILIGDTSKGAPGNSEHTGEFTENYYPLWIDNSPAWAEFPKRNRSFFCTTNKDLAEDYGELFYVVPFDSALMGICPAADIWYSFSAVESLEDLSLRILTLFIFFRKLKITKLKKIDTYKNVVNFFNELTPQKLKELEPQFNADDTIAYKDSVKFLMELLAKFKSTNFAEVMDKILVPKGFKIAHGSDFGNRVGNNNEVFITGKVILIPTNNKEFAEYIKNFQTKNDQAPKTDQNLAPKDIDWKVGDRVEFTDDRLRTNVGEIISVYERGSSKKLPPHPLGSAFAGEWKDLVNYVKCLYIDANNKKFFIPLLGTAKVKKL